MKSLEPFTDQYFKSIRFIVASDRLRELGEMAKNDIVRAWIRELWMVPTVSEGNTLKLLNFGLSHYAVSSKSCEGVEGDELEVRYATK